MSRRQMMKRLRILLADDHDLIRQGLSVLIEREPTWKVCGLAKTGPEAVNEAIRLRPDIVVADFKLPGFDGLEVTRRIRAQEKLEGLPRSPIIG